jgi:hypothetical protein
MAEDWDQPTISREFVKAIRDEREPGVGPATHSRGHEQDCTVRSLGAAMVMRAGLDPVTQHAEYREGTYVRPREGQNTDELERAADQGYSYRDFSLIDVCREACRLDGVRIPTARGELIKRAVSGSALSEIFTDSVGAQLLQGYTDQADSTVGWCSESDVSDFKKQERHATAKFGALKKLPRGGTAEHLDTESGKEEYKIARYAGQFVVDDQDIIDDRFGAILQLSPSDMGASAAQLRPNMVYYILLANQALDAGGALFNSTAETSVNGHANLTTDALDAAGLQAAIVSMGKKRIKKRPLNIRGRFLLLPQDIRFTAQIILESAERVGTGAPGTGGGDGTFNPLKNEGIDIRFDDRLGVGGVVDPVTDTAKLGTATNWFLVARPGENGAKTIEVGYLRGTGRAPQIRSGVLTQGRWGLYWDVNHDIGAKALDYRCMHKSTGAS